MPKLKTNKSVKKRFKITKRGKVLTGKTRRRHLLTDKANQKKRRMRRATLLKSSDVTKIKHLLPYG